MRGTFKNFTRKREDFVCRQCKTKVRGDGYTNHCPQCLWSRHVDVVPGDRAAKCRGMMEPVEVEMKSGEYILVHRCQKCGVKKRNKLAKEDDFQKLIEISSKR